jgi:hypothetical protein
MKGGISLSKGESSRPIYRMEYEELLSELVTPGSIMNSPGRATDSDGKFRTTLDRVCRTSLEAFLVVIPVLDLRGGLW